MAKTLSSTKNSPKRKPGLGRRNTMLVGFTGLIIIAILGIFVGVLPTYNSYKASKEELASAQERLDLATAALTTAQSYQENYPTVKAFADDLDSRFPATAATPELNAAITNAAISAGIPASNISSISTSAPEPLNPIAATAPIAEVDQGGASAGEAAPEGEEGAAPAAEPAPVVNQEAMMNVSVNITGSPEQLIAFASNLSESQRAFLINSMSVATSEEGDSSLDISMTSYLHQTVPLPAPEVENPEDGDQ